ncbi:MAG: citrate (Si)-synthase, partial [Ferruginibacter sp.]
MGIIKERFKEKADQVAAEIKDLLKEHGDKKIGEVTLAQVYQGMRGITGLVTETSLLDAQEGIRFRGYSIPELQQKLTKAKGGNEPLPEGLFYLMLVGELPTDDDVHYLSSVLQRRSHVPNHVFATIEALPVSAHPMTQFVVAIMALQTESLFAKNYSKGMNKKDYWDATFDDAMDLIARLPRIAAYIYRRKYKKGDHIQPNGLLDWAGNFAHMMGYEDEGFKELMRLYMTIHADHEGGNVSAHTTHLVGSALSDPYLCLAAGMNGLAGPLHGLANQEVIKWI